MYQVLFIFIKFLLCSFIGWIIEIIGCSITNKKFINRGFLVGPYLPIYGFGCLLISLVCKPYIQDILITFVLIVFLTSTLEYLTGYFLEKVFHARWWDYSDRSFNLDGRVCFTNSFLFGIAGIGYLLYVEPTMNHLLKSIPLDIFYVITSPLLILFLIDIVISFRLTFHLRQSFTALRKDYTSEISSKIQKKLIEQSKSFKRILQAFPNAKLIGKGKKRLFFKKSR